MTEKGKYLARYKNTHRRPSAHIHRPAVAAGGTGSSVLTPMMLVVCVKSVPEVGGKWEGRGGGEGSSC